MASDFGSHANVYRNDGRVPNSADEEKILAAARALTASDHNRISRFADFELVLGSSRDVDGTEGVSLRLTSYFFDDLENEESADAIIAQDDINAYEFGAELEKALGPDYRVEPFSGHW